MAIVLDELTRAEYLALSSATGRATLIVSALTGTVTVEIRNGSDTLMASGTMASPWATATSGTVTIGEVTAIGMDVAVGGVPDDNWYLQFKAGSRFLRGTFGLPSTSADFKWTRPAFQTGSRGTLGTIVINAAGVPEVVTNPSITGTAQVGQLLTGDDGTWSGSPTAYQYQHQRSDNGTSGWADISGATGASYLQASADLAKYVRRGVRAQNVSGTSAYAYSAASGPVTAAGDVALLSPSDFTYLGYYDITFNGTDEIYTAGMALRRVGSEIRFIRRSFDPFGFGSFHEFSIAGKSYGQSITASTRTWTASAPSLPSSIGITQNFTWDEGTQRLWVQGANDYPNDDLTRPGIVRLVDLPAASGPITNVHTFSIAGVADRRAYTGIAAVPASIQAAWGVGPYVVGMGGYASRVEIGGTAALGFAGWIVPNPLNYASGTEFSASQYKTIANRGLTPRGERLWYGYTFTKTGTKTFFQGGAGSGGTMQAQWIGATVDSGTFTGKGPLNFMEGGDVRENPPIDQPPTFEPVPGAAFNGQIGSTGRAYWVQQGEFYVGGFWIDTPTKRGFVTVGSFMANITYYAESAGRAPLRIAELHVFNPDHFKEVIDGVRAPGNVQPAAMRALPEADTSDAYHSRHEASYDPVDKRLYVAVRDWANFRRTRLLVYQINA